MNFELVQSVQLKRTDF